MFIRVRALARHQSGEHHGCADIFVGVRLSSSGCLFARPDCGTDTGVTVNYWNYQSAHLSNYLFGSGGYYSPPPPPSSYVSVLCRSSFALPIDAAGPTRPVAGSYSVSG